MLCCNDLPSSISVAHVTARESDLFSSYWPDNFVRSHTSTSVHCWSLIFFVQLNIDSKKEREMCSKNQHLPWKTTRKCHRETILTVKNDDNEKTICRIGRRSCHPNVVLCLDSKKGRIWKEMRLSNRPWNDARWIQGRAAVQTPLSLSFASWQRLNCWSDSNIRSTALLF